jgi:pilus assembly protein CpaE
MRVLIVHAPGSSIRELRQSTLGAGGECLAEDCVAPENLAARLAQVPANLIVVRAKSNGLNLGAMSDALALATAPVVVVGDDTTADRAVAQQLSASEFIVESEARERLEQVIQRAMPQAADAAGPRGILVSVYAPLPGSGGTTVASNLAGAFAAAHPKGAALVELARDFGDLALLLNINPAHTAREACRRWQSLDRISLESSFEEHPSGASVLVNGVEQFQNEFLSRDSVRRLALLSRFVHSYTVFALESRLEAEELEVMRLSDRVVLVVRPDVVAVRRARWALDKFEEEGLARERINLVVNRWGQGGQLTLQQIEQTLGHKAIEQIPDDPGRLNQATNQGVLLQQYARRATISKRFDSLATKLNGKKS